MEPKQQPVYDVQFFIDKFSKIPDNDWGIKSYVDEFNKKCALGHCGISVSLFQTNAPEASAVHSIFMESGLNILTINDGEALRYQQPTPKARILAALNDIKAMQKPTEKPATPPETEKVRYVVVHISERIEQEAGRLIESKN